jgi:outer membrane protein assembly factor BamB
VVDSRTTISCRRLPLRYSFYDIPAASVLLLLALFAGAVEAQSPSSSPPAPPVPDLPAAALPGNLEGPLKGKAAEPAKPLVFPMGEAWSAVLPGPPAAWPAYDETHAYVPLRTGQIAAVSLHRGEVDWTHDLATSIQPAAGDDAVYVAAEGAIQALARPDGRVRWTTPLASGVAAPLLWDTGWLIAALESQEIVAFRAESGERLWSEPMPAPVRVSPAIAADRLYVSLTSGGILALDLTTGKRVWEQRVGGDVTEILALDDRLFVGSRDNFFYCLALSTGRISWRWRVGADVIGAPIVDESRVYFTALDNLLRALDRRHGAQRWRQPMPIRPLAGPVRIDDVVIVSGLGVEVTGFSGRTGKEVGRFTASSEIVAPPHFVDAPIPEDRTLYILTGEGTLHAVRHMVEPRVIPLEFVPGTPTPLEGAPPEPVRYIPGVPVPLIPAPSPLDGFTPGRRLPIDRPANPFDEFLPGEPIPLPEIFLRQSGRMAGGEGFEGR